MALAYRPKVLNLFTLVMINIIAVDSLRSLPTSATYGMSLFFIYGLSALLFFIPSALVSAELATAWPNTGGIYVWVREAFGRKTGFFIIIMQWLYNIVWFPTIMAFIVSSALYYISPPLSQDSHIIFVSVLALFWIVTFINAQGMKASALLSTVGALIGTLLPMILISVLGLVWYFMGSPIPASYTDAPLIPNIFHMENAAFLVPVLFGFMGLEMSAVHAGEVKNPKRDYPWALLISALVIMLSLLCSSLAIALVVPKSDINIVTGVVQAYESIFKHFGLEWLTPIVVGCIILGTVGTAGAWIIGPAKGVYVAAEDGSLPAYFTKTNKHGVPTVMLALQGIVFTLLSLLFLIQPTISGMYWVLGDMTGQLALIVYIGLFAAALRLRYKQPDAPRAFQVPGGKVALWIMCGIATLSCVTVMVLGFFPPAQVMTSHYYQLALGGGMLFFCALPFLLYRK